MFNPASDIPRNAPLPASVGKHALAPSVPEISMILNNAPYNPHQNRSNPQPFHFFGGHDKENKPRFCGHNKSVNHGDMHKQVRFHSPPPTANDQFRKPMIRNVLPDKTNILPNNFMPKPNQKFTEVYMANIPNRHLDLSMIDNCSVNKQDFSPTQSDSQKQKSPVIDLESIHKKFDVHAPGKEQMQKLDISNIHNYKSHSNANSTVNNETSGIGKSTEPFDSNLEYSRGFSRDLVGNQQKSHSTALEKKTGVSDSLEQSEWGKVATKSVSDEPTIKDLLKIIQQQNEQLLILQKQVSHLIEYQAVQQAERSQRPIADSEFTDYYCQKQTNHFQDVLTDEKRENLKYKDLKKGPLSKFAIDVTTSFEVSVRRQQNSEQRNKYKPCLQQEQKIREITEGSASPLPCPNRFLLNDKAIKTGDGSKSMSESLVLDERLSVREDCPSPVNSIHVDMNDYSSESDDDSTSSSSNIDWTLYNNIMSQVNNILRNAQNSTDDKAESESSCKDETMKKVMEATVKHLKSVGISLSGNKAEDNLLRSVEDTKKYTSAEISFAVKQLLMKYLPPEHLAKVACTKNNPSSSNCSNETADLVKKRPEFSFATVQYMKKYNLIRTEPGQQKQAKAGPKETTKQKNMCPKILDITALKQQPKLL